MSNKKRMAPDERKETILTAAVSVAKTNGYNKMTRDDIARHAGVSTGLVTFYFSTMTQLRRAVIRSAITNEVLEVVAQGLAIGDDQAKKAPDELKKRATDFLINN